MGWGELPPAGNEGNVSCDNGVDNWERTTDQANNKVFP